MALLQIAVKQTFVIFCPYFTLMIKTHYSVVTTALILVLTFASVGQKRTASPSIDERNVRAEMNFLAGDAMQGRGSGSMFERIAAEYIGSQFMQFGLEAAGEKDAAGNPTYVQTVEVPGRSQLQDVKIGGELSSSLKFNQDFVAWEVSKPQLSGELQRIKLGETPKKGT